MLCVQGTEKASFITRALAKNQFIHHKARILQTNYFFALLESPTLPRSSHSVTCAYHCRMWEKRAGRPGEVLSFYFAL